MDDFENQIEEWYFTALDDNFEDIPTNLTVIFYKDKGMSNDEMEKIETWFAYRLSHGITNYKYFESEQELIFIEIATRLGFNVKFEEAKGQPFKVIEVLTDKDVTFQCVEKRAIFYNVVKEEE